MNQLISVIVPIYGIDKYLGLCIESIIKQTYRNLEIILVDDGSPDRSPELCELYAKKDSRIKVVHKPNGGLVSARKAGLRESCGSYVSYVDGDDWIEPCFIESLYKEAYDSDADMVCAGFSRDLFSKSDSFLNEFPTGLYTGEQLILLWKNMLSFPPFYRPGVTTYVWNKLFRREVLLDAQFSVDNRISIGEDGAVTYPALLNCKKVLLTDNVLYHYRQREDSMLKQRAEYSQEAENLAYLYNYLKRWTEKADARYHLSEQLEDYVLANAIIRSGGYLPHEDYSAFAPVYFGKKVVVYNAGTFGQQLVNRFMQTNHCQVVAWIDEDYWEYRRCCLDVDPVESILSLCFEYVLVAKVDGTISEDVFNRLIALGVRRERIIPVTVPNNKKELIHKFLNVNAIIAYETKRKQEVSSHA